jgi:hypothetical protein
MARVSPLDLRREDFPKMEGEAIDRLFRRLNQFSAEVAATLNATTAIEREVTFLNASGLPFTFRNPLPSRPSSVTIAQAWDITATKEVPVSLGGVSWQPAGTEIKVTGFGNVSPDTKYRVRLRIGAE